MSNIKFTSFPNNSNWVRGNAGNKHVFEAKLYNDGSPYGIDGGRVSKLLIIDHVLDEDVVIYERGWDLKPETAEQMEIYEEIMDFLENSPQREFEQGGYGE